MGIGMRKSNIGGIIIAASIKRAKPMLKLGSIPVVKRIVLAFQQAEVFPIVVITGTQEEEVRHELSEFGVVFLKNENCEDATMFESLKIGLRYLQDKCSHIAIAPVNSPMFTPETLKKLHNVASEVAFPVYKGQAGYPILISTSAVGKVMNYKDEEEFKSNIYSCSEHHVSVDVDDEGVVQDIHSYEQLQKLLEKYNRALMQVFVGLSIEKESVFFDNRAKLLLYLISETMSVSKACELMSMSYAKAWKVLNKLEFELGYTIIQRRQGGNRVGRTLLTKKGMEFLQAYIEYEDSVFQYARAEFVRIFKDKELI
jgi:molybdate transport repressor ModE-like protein